MARKKQTQNCLLFAGALHIDELATLRNPMVMRASNPVDWRYSIGGVAANCALAAAEVAISSRSIVLTAAVGNDEMAQLMIQSLKSHQIEVHAQVYKQLDSGRYTAVLDASGELLMGLADVDLAEHLSGEHVTKLAQSVEPAAVLVDANLSDHCLGLVASFCNDRSLPLAAMAVSPVKARKLLSLSSVIDLLFCNRREAMALIGEDLSASEANGKQNDSARLSINELADKLQQRGFEQFVLTDGEKELVVQTGDTQTIVQVPTVAVANHVNGAGDALAGAGYAAFANKLPLAEAIRRYGLPGAGQIIRGERKAIPLSQRSTG